MTRLLRRVLAPPRLNADPRTHVLLLDVDGVLVTPPEWFGVRLRRESPTLTRQFFETAFHSASTGQSDLKEHLPDFIAALGRDQTPDEFLHEWLDSENHPNRALLTAVRELRAQGWHSYLATNQEAHRTKHLLEVVGLGDVVDGHFASCMVGHRKPSPEYYAEVTRRMGDDAAHLVFWDDNRDNVQAAREAGWQAFRYTSVRHFRRVMAVG
ncbi:MULTISPECIES: HAD family hydrolase [Deinococcus]|uniref:HAD family phosphatase n=1 Tax=Deinococcus rufus TaxID=2136097 RepID=A0ABV7Z4E0_9DEIO|nr:HAD family phosphatase [Deinococcus sp. AB2017081]WQE95760.1 HAD family phosphatase [Deinococcus sp. AB2017081]